MMKTFDIDGVKVDWNFFTLSWGDIYSVPFAHEPTEIEIRAVLIGWENGYRHGMSVGRSVLQNEFRNLMDCQPR